MVAQPLATTFVGCAPCLRVSVVNTLSCFHEFRFWNSCRLGCLFGFPAQDWFASGRSLIHTGDTGIVRSADYQLRVVLHLARNRLHGVNKEVKLFLGLALRR